MKKKVLFIDRDGTIIVEPASDFQIDSLEKLEFIPGAITYLNRIAKELDYELVMVTNQDGMGTPTFPEDTFWPAHNKMMGILKGEGILFSEVHIDKSFEKDNLPTRKPGIGMLKKYFSDEYDLANSIVIGDRLTDVKLAKNLGSKAILIKSAIHLNEMEEELRKIVLLETNSWEEIYKSIKLPPRIASVSRNTNETKINIEMNLDGNGRAEISTGLSFFDHMLDQIARHSGIDLKVNVK